MPPWKISYIFLFSLLKVLQSSETYRNGFRVELHENREVVFCRINVPCLNEWGFGHRDARYSVTLFQVKGIGSFFCIMRQVNLSNKDVMFMSSTCIINTKTRDEFYQRTQRLSVLEALATVRVLVPVHSKSVGLMSLILSYQTVVHGTHV